MGVRPGRWVAGSGRGGRLAANAYGGGMDYRYLGNSGLKVSEITYGNWLTHGSQIENDAATQCVRAALDAGSPRSTRRTSTPTPRRRRCSATRCRGSGASRLEIFTKVFWPTGPAGKNDAACRASTSWSRSTGRCTRLQTDYVDLYQAHRYDLETPLEETMQAFADVVRQGKALYIGVSEWTADQIRAGARLARSWGSSSSPTSRSTRCCGASSRPRWSRRRTELGVSQIVWSPDRPGRADRQVCAGSGAAGGLAGDRRGGRRRQFIQRLHEGRRAHPRCRRSSRWPTNSG